MSPCRFSLLEHAPQGEREEKFMEYIQQRKLPMTLLDLGINIELDLADLPRIPNSNENGANRVYFESSPFIFNGVYVRVVGWMHVRELNGQAKFEFVEGHSANEIDYLSIHEMRILQANGLPIDLPRNSNQDTNANSNNNNAQAGGARRA